MDFFFLKTVKADALHLKGSSVIARQGGEDTVGNRAETQSPTTLRLFQVGDSRRVGRQAGWKPGLGTRWPPASSCCLPRGWSSAEACCPRSRSRWSCSPSRSRSRKCSLSRWRSCCRRCCCCCRPCWMAPNLYSWSAVPRSCQSTRPPKKERERKPNEQTGNTSRLPSWQSKEEAQTAHICQTGPGLRTTIKAQSSQNQTKLDPEIKLRANSAHSPLGTGLMRGYLEGGGVAPSASFKVAAVLRTVFLKKNPYRFERLQRPQNILQTLKNNSAFRGKYLMARKLQKGHRVLP